MIKEFALSSSRIWRIMSFPDANNVCESCTLCYQVWLWPLRCRVSGCHRWLFRRLVKIIISYTGNRSAIFAKNERNCFIYSCFLYSCENMFFVPGIPRNILYDITRTWCVYWRPPNKKQLRAYWAIKFLIWKGVFA